MLTQRPVFVALFLLALLGFNSLWVLAGGQYHLDLIFWPWKLVLSLTAAAAITILATASGKRLWLAASLLLAAMAAAGLVTWQAHLNEPADQDEETTDQLTRSRQLRDTSGNREVLSARLAIERKSRNGAATW